MDPFIQLVRRIKEFGLEALGRYYSRYPAFVADRDDPEHRGRLRLVVPMITRDAPMKYWALPSTPSGNGYGSQWLPRRGELVWVTFEHGDRRYPQWHHGYYGKDEAPEPDELKEYDNYWVRTPNGITIEARDYAKEVHVTVPVDTSNNDTLKLVIDSQGISLIRDSLAISLGQLGQSAQPAVLGDNNESALNELASKIDAIHQAIATASTGTQDGGILLQSDILASLTAAQFPISPSFTNQAAQTKSDNVTLD